MGLLDVTLVVLNQTPCRIQVTHFLDRVNSNTSDWLLGKGSNWYWRIHGKPLRQMNVKNLIYRKRALLRWQSTQENANAILSNWSMYCLNIRLILRICHRQITTSFLIKKICLDRISGQNKRNHYSHFEEHYTNWINNLKKVKRLY